MIAADTSAILHFLHGFDSPARRAVRAALVDATLVLPSVVVTELLSGVRQETGLTSLLTMAPRMVPADGYWERTGTARRLVRSLGLKARLADALVAQACLDADIPLIASDGDFRHFAAHCGLKLAV